MAIDDYIGRWAFDENTGTSAADSCAVGNTGTLQNTPTWVAPGKNGAANLSFASASSEYVSVPHHAAYNFSGPITMAAWIKPTSTAINASHAYVLGKWNGSQEQFSMRFQSGQIFHVGSWNGADRYVQYNWALPADVWYHVVGRYDGTAWKLYIDGVEVASRNDATGALSGTSGALHLGAANTGSAGRYWDGEIDDIRIYNRALNATEIALLASETAVTRIYTAADISGGSIDVPSDYNASLNCWHAIGGSPAATDPGSVGGGGWHHSDLWHGLCGWQ